MVHPNDIQATPGAVAAELPSSQEQRRSSNQGTERNTSVIAKVAEKLHITEQPEDKGNDFDSLSSGEEAIFASKQAQGETFADGGETRYYRPILKYEGYHRWDPKAEWSEKEEQKIVRKVRYMNMNTLLVI